jgi:hypothetical protein
MGKYTERINHMSFSGCNVKGANDNQGNDIQGKGRQVTNVRNQIRWKGNDASYKVTYENPLTLVT